MNINRVSYVTDIKYISGMIREYDITKANINILYSLGQINKELYEKLYYSDRMYRQIYIGNLIKENKEISKILKKGIIDYKQKFYESNNITEDNIISIHNDSVFLLNIIPNNTVFDNVVEFKFKGQYISFWKLFSLEIYYGFDSISQIESISVKGINDILLKKHENYFLEFLKALFMEVETNGISYGIQMLKSFSDQYLNRKLDPEYYREFNDKSLINVNNQFYIDYCKQDQLRFIDISYNYNLLRELYAIMASQIL